jgi:hypothetical protein
MSEPNEDAIKALSHLSYTEIYAQMQALKAHKPRLHDGLRLAIVDIKLAASLALKEHDLTANELIVALAAVASAWVPSSHIEQDLRKSENT